VNQLDDTTYCNEKPDLEHLPKQWIDVSGETNAFENEEFVN